ncbi:glycosyltransferase [Cellulomonas sp. URHB0016]
MTRIALFDDFTDTVLGHHPDFVVGLANAAATLSDGQDGQDGQDGTRLYCPPSYLTGHRLCAGVVHRPVAGASPSSTGAKLPYSQSVDPANLASAVRDAADHGTDLFLNCYFDENYPAWPGPSTGLRHVHALHRPGYFAADAAGQLTGTQRLADMVRARAGDAVFVVNTRVGERQAHEFMDPHAVLRTGWPTATRAEVAHWFEAPRPAGDQEPYVLSIGSARSDKGVDVLLSALADGPTVKILGQQYDGVEERIRREHPRTRVDWESGWISRDRLGEVISGAAVVVFPYQEEFAGFGGASGALAQALTVGKPVIVSEVLADQVPDSPACRVVGTTDVVALRTAVDDALRNTAELHLAAAGLRGHVEANHTYEGYLERILDRCS